MAARTVFKDTKGGFQRKRAVYQMWQRVHRKAGVERDGRSPHNARHTHASLLLSGGSLIADVSRRLGHDSIQTTLQFYSTWLPGQDRTGPDEGKDGVRKLTESASAETAGRAE
jgi:integrase